MAILEETCGVTIWRLVLPCLSGTSSYAVFLYLYVGNITFGNLEQFLFHKYAIFRVFPALSNIVICGFCV